MSDKIIFNDKTIFSENINELFGALAKAQGAMQPAIKDSRNPYLKNKYATLDSILKSIRQPLSDNGLAITQLISTGADGDYLLTVLGHESGQWLMSLWKYPSLTMKGINSLQAMGGSLTYAKRYALSAILGIATDEDTDGDTPDTPEIEAIKLYIKENLGGKPAPVKMSELQASIENGVLDYTGELSIAKITKWSK